MKGQFKTGRRLLTVLFASAALSVAQVNSMSAPAASLQGPNNATQAERSAAPVGPGRVNYVEGQVSLAGQDLSSRSVGTAALNPGQELETGVGYVEVLLTPGAFLRVGPNSAIRLLTASLADTRVEFVRGSGMLEVDQLIKGTNLNVVMNGATARIEKKGLYNFDAAGPAIRVLDGKTNVTTGDHGKSFGKNDEILVANAQPLKARHFNASSVENEPLYVWSKARSQDEAQANVAAAANPTFYAGAGPGWYWDPYFGSYGFWPASAFLYSPFGWGFYSPAYFGYYGGYGYGFYGNRVWRSVPALHGRVGGVNARVGAVRASGFRSSGFAAGGGFHGGFGGGGFHGGGHR